MCSQIAELIDLFIELYCLDHSMKLMSVSLTFLAHVNVKYLISAMILL